MDWYFRALKQKPWTWSEPLVNCQTCQVSQPLRPGKPYQQDTKCCEFSPFWSAFAAGAWMEANGPQVLRELSSQGGSVLPTRLGLVHTREHRQQSSALCQYFETQSKACKIWSQRPATCFHFFCASSVSKKEQRDQIEWQWLRQEAHWLKQWFLECLKGSPMVWQQWGEFMQEEAAQALPEALALDWEEAESNYTSAWKWLCDRKGTL